MSIATVNWEELTAQERKRCLQRPAVASEEPIRQSVQAIIAAVQDQGDDALRQLTEQFDHVLLDDIPVSEAEIATAISELSESQIAAIDLAIENVRCFHEAQVPADIKIETMPGVSCERRSHALDAVGLYVPAGSAPLPSAAIMLSVPATIAGCREIVLCTPPRADGRADPGVVVAATRAGVRKIFKVGGAQAIAAMAYGTQSIPKVGKLFGPGNAYVTCAKTLVSADPRGAAIDMPAGPSEVLVIADAAANVEYVASDLLSQAEHGPDSQVLLLTDSQQFADACQKEIAQQLENLPRASIATQALRHSKIVIVESIAAATVLSNQYAPEHLILQVARPREVLTDVRNAGSVFLGEWTPESVGDYCSGTNHVLPTYGYAKTYSGLGVDQFLRYMTVQEVSQDGLQQLGGAVIILARMEGLEAHASAVVRRLRRST